VLSPNRQKGAATSRTVFSGCPSNQRTPPTKEETGAAPLSRQSAVAVHAELAGIATFHANDMLVTPEGDA